MKIGVKIGSTYEGKKGTTRTVYAFGKMMFCMDHGEGFKISSSGSHYVYGTPGSNTQVYYRTQKGTSRYCTVETFQRWAVREIQATPQEN